MIKDEEITSIVIFKATPGGAEELGQILTGLISGSRNEPGCIQYDIHHSEADGATWMAFERWSNQAAFDAHVATPAVQSLLAKLPELLADELDMKFYRRIET